MGATTATGHHSPPGTGRPAGAIRRSAAQLRLQAREADDRLGVRRLRDQRLEVGQRPRLDVDPLVLVDLGLLVGVGDSRRQEEVDLLVGEAGRGVEGAQRLPVLGLLADLLGQLALGGLQRLLALLVELAGRYLEQVRRADRLPRLAHEPQLLAVQHDDPDGAGVDDDLALGVLAVLVAERLPADAEEFALEEGLGVGALEGGAHAVGCSAVVGWGSGSAAAASSSASATSSMPSSAATDTRSVGSWLRSVPLARCTHGNPATSSALASDPPPVTMRRGA